MRILTNMRFWQSRTWTAAVTSIYPGHRQPLGRKMLSPLREAMALCRQSKHFDIVVTMGARESLYYGLFCLIRRRPSKQIACEVFVDDPQPRNPVWGLKQSLYRLVMRRAVGLLTNSTVEIESAADRFSVPRDRIRYVPLHTNIADPKISTRDEGFVLSAGHTRRDYQTLIEASRRCLVPLVIVCGHDQELTTPLPKHVRVHRDVSRYEYLDLLARCSFVVVPLIPAARATGQVVILEAMGVGKAVIATQTAGALDLIHHGINGLLVPPFDVPALASAMQRLVNEPETRRRFAETALQDILREHTIETHAARKLAAIEELFRLYGGVPSSTR